MMIGSLQLVSIWLSLLPTVFGRDTVLVANPSWKTPIIGDELPVEIADCVGEGPFIQQDFADALALAKSARDVLTGGFQSANVQRWFETLFTDRKNPDNQVTANRADIRDDFGAVYTNNGLPSEIIFHCNEEWRDALFARRSIAQIDKPWSGCDSTTQAITTRIRSGDFPPDLDGDYGPNGAFRTGTHIMLCPQFFDIKPLGEIAPVTAGVAINDRINRGMVMLHELMHAFDKGIRDGGYGYGGCIDVCYGRIRRDMDNVRPAGNADSFALFALGVSSTQNMISWDWSSGLAAVPSSAKRDLMGGIFGLSGNDSIIKIPYSLPQVQEN